VINEKLINYYEPSAGFTLGFDFANSERSSAELILDGDAAFRLYRGKDDADPLRSTWYWADSTYSTVFPTFPNPTAHPVDQEYAVTVPLDLRIISTPRFVYTGDISEKLTLGAKVQVGMGFDALTISQEDIGSVNEYESTITSFTVTPDFSLGASFHLIPDHFSLHAGLGLTLFSYREVLTKTDVNGTSSPEVTTKTMYLPSARFAAGLTLNLTEAVAMDLMAINSGLEIDATKFTLLLTVKR
ncbi:MAG: hypothetical protein LBT39_10020, partial [Treponema sp.]|jgi:hypothetical protein|nr:hypothetical protein [Treponema sp.]